MKKIITFWLTLVFIFGCEDQLTTTKPIDDKPTIKIISPKDSTAFENSLLIEAAANDDKGIVQVNIYIDNETDSSKTLFVDPYRYVWIPSPTEPDSTRHTIYAKAYDGDGNRTSSTLLTALHVYLPPPSDLSVKSISKTKIKLNWENNLTNRKGFIIERRAIDQDSTFRVIGETNYYTYYFIDDRLSLNKQYIYRVKAFRVSDTTAYSKEIQIKFIIEYSVDLQFGDGNGIPYKRTPLSYGFDNSSFFFAYQNDYCYNDVNYQSHNHSFRCLGNQTKIITDISSVKVSRALFSTEIGKVLVLTPLSFKTFIMGSDPISESVFLNNSDIFAAAISNGEIRIVRFNDSQVLSQYSTINPQGHIYLAYNRSDSILISATEYGDITYWSVPKQNIVKHQNFDVHITAFSYDKYYNKLYIGQENGMLFNVDLKTFSRNEDFQVSGSEVTAVTTAQRGTYLVTAGNDGLIKLWLRDMHNYYALDNENMKTAISLMVVDDLSEIVASSQNSVVFWKNTSGWRTFR